MNTARRLIVVLVGLALSMATNVVVNINGWGLEPKSWGWIIGVYLVGQMVANILVMIGKDE